jgi:Reverse transcriptase (RNA-dependent DNA polymerase)
VDTIRAAMASAPQPVIEYRKCTVLWALDAVTIAEIKRSLVRHLRNTALDPAPTWLMKPAVPILASTITLMCNASLTEGVFPDTLKHAVVRPRLKKPMLNPDELSSYRPILNLSFISKIVERVVAARFAIHAALQCLRPCRQSTYRANHSTKTAVRAVHDEIVFRIDSGKVCVQVLCDLNAAFDTVDHDTPLQVLGRQFGVDGSALVWNKSYLADRTQIFQLGAQQSGPHIVDCSMPQKSVLGPQSFIAYIDDLACLIDRHELGHHLPHDARANTFLVCAHYGDKSKC